ncbi:MAG: hypothetical protein K1W16_04200 [Lachnospiraceae bacterium]|jgi:hypothetical protein
MGVVHTKVAAVLMFVDAVAERRVRYRGLQIRTNPPSKVVWKDMDCAVILAQKNICKMDIVILGKFYQEVHMQIELRSDNAPQVHTIWLSPSEYYPFLENMTILRGRCLKKEFYILWPADNTKYKLLETTIVGSNCISIWGIDGSIEGRMFVLREDKMELVTLVGQVEQGIHTYHTKTVIQQVFHRGKAKLYKAAKVQIDCNGEFFMGFQKETQEKDEVLFWSEGEIVEVSLFG